jgi:hypothetical protein
MPVTYYPTYVTAADPAERPLATFDGAAVLAVRPQWFLWHRWRSIAGGGLHRLPRARWTETLGRIGGVGARPSDPIFCCAGRGVGAGLRRSP